MEEYDKVVVETFRSLLDISALNLDEKAIRQINLRSEMAALSLRSAARHAARNHYASMVSYSAYEKWDPATEPEYAELHARFKDMLKKKKGDTDEMMQDTIQQKLSRKIDAAELDELLKPAPGPANGELTEEHRQARLRSSSSHGARSMFSALPSRYNGTALTHAEFITYVKWCLGLPHNLPLRCPSCDILKKQDPHGHPPVICSNKPGINGKHNALRHCVFTTARTSGFVPSLEKAVPSPDQTLRPA
eukprot:CAMPEP_0184710712 /NCGR_PEP_ID=MMETSP0314-20130426/1474_1 /TAXON_ID=38298 /ORGANISM="Rhodella maculata, Strain CCMP 736" /LENGTH=247 /DNA_ID=CAMNT_0027172609 /DNA_START=26 /DNA_END=765 /DNA_ORIENTATION=-